MPTATASQALYCECPNGHPNSVTHERVKRPTKCMVGWCNGKLDWNKPTRRKKETND